MDELQLTPGEEQIIAVGQYSIEFKFNPFARQWVFTIRDAEDNIVVGDIAILPDTWPLKGIDSKYNWPRICMIDKYPDSVEPINPYLDFGDRLGIFEITQG